LLGTRPGGAIAAAWASMKTIGEDGYLKLAKETMEITRRLIDGVNAIPGLRVVAQPHMSVFCYESTSRELNIFAVGDQMEKRGWHIDRQQRPDSLHAMVTPRHAPVIEQYLADLRDSVDEVKKHPELGERGGAAMYGMISHIPLRGLVRQNVMKMMTELYGPEGKQPNLSDEPPDDLATKAGLLFLRLRDELAKKLERKS
jgi:hypothetical protein